MEENIMEDFKIYYDEKEDILFLGKEGLEAEVLEISPGINMELDEAGQLIGVEVFRASLLFKDVIKSMGKKLQAA
jgi:uncharacterized protein YuzE